MCFISFIRFCQCATNSATHTTHLHGLNLVPFPSSYLGAHDKISALIRGGRDIRILFLAYVRTQ